MSKNNGNITAVNPTFDIQQNSNLTVNSGLTAENVAKAMRLLMKAHKIDSRSIPRYGDGAKKTRFRKDAFSLLGFTNMNSETLIQDISDKIKDIDEVVIRNELEKHYVDKDKYKNRIQRATALFKQIKAENNDVMRNASEPETRPNRRKAAAAYDRINKGFTRSAIASDDVQEFESNNTGRSSIVDYLQRDAENKQSDWLRSVDENNDSTVGDQNSTSTESPYDIPTRIGGIFTGDNNASSSVPNQEGVQNGSSSIQTGRQEAIYDKSSPTKYDNSGNGGIYATVKKVGNRRPLIDVANKRGSALLPGTPDNSSVASSRPVVSPPRPPKRSSSNQQQFVLPEQGQQQYKLPDYLKEHIAALVKAGKEHVFFDLDDTLIKHAITDDANREKIFGKVSDLGCVDSKGRAYPTMSLVTTELASFTHDSRQNFNEDTKNFIASLVKDPQMVRVFMDECDLNGLQVHISTLNTHQLATVLAKKHEWPITSISAINGQVKEFDSAQEVQDVNEGVMTGKGTNPKGKDYNKKVFATMSIVGKGLDLSSVAFYDDDFSKGRSWTCNELEDLGVTCLMKGQEEGVRFSEDHQNFQTEIESVTGDLEKKAASRANNDDIISPVRGDSPPPPLPIKQTPPIPAPRNRRNISSTIATSSGGDNPPPLPIKQTPSSSGTIDVSSDSVVTDLTQTPPAVNKNPERVKFIPFARRGNDSSQIQDSEPTHEDPKTLRDNDGRRVVPPVPPRRPSSSTVTTEAKEPNSLTGGSDRDSGSDVELW